MNVFLFGLTVLFVWLTVCTVSGFGEMVGWWDYADVCTPADALTFCWTGPK